MLSVLMRISYMRCSGTGIFVFCTALLGCSVSRADVFSSSRSLNNDLRNVAAVDRAAYYYQTQGADYRKAVEKVSDLDKGETGQLQQAILLDDVDYGLRRDLQTALKPLIAGRILDKVPANANDLLRLSYSSPALADIVKHYRVIGMQRLVLEEFRRLRSDVSLESLTERLRSASERECLRVHQTEGFVGAITACRKDREPFRYLPRIADKGNLTDGRRTIHVVRDSVGRLGLSKLGAGEDVANLCGDTVITNNDVREMFPKQTFASLADAARKKFLSVWEKSLADFVEDGDVSAGKLESLSLSGAPVTLTTFGELSMLDASARRLRILVFSSFLSMAQVRNQYVQAVEYLEYCLLLADLPEVYRAVMKEKKCFLEKVISVQSDEEDLSGRYKLAIGGLTDTADIVRDGLLCGGNVCRFDLLAGSSDQEKAFGLMINY